MKYTLTVPEMHCNGCRNLIKITLQELGFEDIDVNLDKMLATFNSELKYQDVEKELIKAFSELEGYSFKDLLV